MAKLRDCRHCGYRVSRTAARCPSCDASHPGRMLPDSVRSFLWAVTLVGASILAVLVWASQNPREDPGPTVNIEDLVDPSPSDLESFGPLPSESADDYSVPDY